MRPVYRFDLHVHSHYSADACDSPEALVETARARGLHGIAITDHDDTSAHAHCLATGLARPDGSAVGGFLVVPGIEISTADGHLLCLGVQPGALTGAPAADACRIILEMGGVPVPAHPFDPWRHGMGAATLDRLPLSTLEVFNSAVTSRRMNEKAAAYAQARGLPGLAGSDAHHASAVGVSHTAFDLHALNLGALLDAVRRGGLPNGSYLSPAEGFRKHAANFLRLFKPGIPSTRRNRTPNKNNDHSKNA